MIIIIYFIPRARVFRVYGRTYTCIYVRVAHVILFDALLLLTQCILFEVEDG